MPIMKATPVIAIFDIGKTNKKIFLFDSNYKIVFEQSEKLTETLDEDDEACENLESLRLFVFDSLRNIFKHKEFSIKAINFCAYGASFVYLDEYGNPLTPLYNYLKAYPHHLQKKFYDTYGGEKKISLKTASPVLGSLNSGMQLYRIKYEKKEIFNRIKYALHLPQYLSYLISGVPCSDITSIGCHTNLWDFGRKQYHEWVLKEGMSEKLAPVEPYNKVLHPAFPGSNYFVGIGLHDSSAALIPYLLNFCEPFVLLSTGTWCISLNPFNNSDLTTKELENDCLCYLTYLGKPVKASRLFSGNEHEQQVKRIAYHFNQKTDRYADIEFDQEILRELKRKESKSDMTNKTVLSKESVFGKRDLSQFSTDKEAYHQLIIDLVQQQVLSTSLVLNGTSTRKIFVDGGFSKNSIYMNLLAMSFPEIEIFAASMAQATALGSALAIHYYWNKEAISGDIIKLKYYSVKHEATL